MTSAAPIPQHTVTPVRSPLFTVCTPSFNRAHLLPRVQESLGQQTFKDFEWLIVDDGSTDSTREVVEAMIASSPFPIRYLFKANGGKHTALNLAVREARGSLFTVLDSDDWFVPTCLERMKAHWDRIPVDQQKAFKGVCGLFAYKSGEVVGTPFPSDTFDSDDLELRLHHQVRGDKIGCMRIEVMREFPFPEDLGDKVEGAPVYISESLVWNRMALKYRTRYVNEVFGGKEYQAGGITDRGRLIKVKNTKATLLYFQEFLNSGRPMPLRHWMRGYANFVRHSLHQGISLRAQFQRIPQPIRLLFCYPLGVALYRGDRKLLEGTKTR